MTTAAIIAMLYIYACATLEAIAIMYAVGKKITITAGTIAASVLLTLLEMTAVIVVWLARSESSLLPTLMGVGALAILGVNLFTSTHDRETFTWRHAAVKATILTVYVVLVARLAFS